MKNKEIDINQFGIVNLVISKQQVEEFDFTEIYPFIETIKAEPRKYYNKIVLLIDGYNEDDRGIYEVIEVRRYIQFLDKCFPYWFYFFARNIPKKYTSHKIILLCICEIEYVKGDKVSKEIKINMDSVARFIENRFVFFNEIMDKERHTDEENRVASKQILELLR